MYFTIDNVAPSDRLEAYIMATMRYSRAKYNLDGDNRNKNLHKISWTDFITELNRAKPRELYFSHYMGNTNTIFTPDTEKYMTPQEKKKYEVVSLEEAIKIILGESESVIPANFPNRKARLKSTSCSRSATTVTSKTENPPEKEKIKESVYELNLPENSKSKKRKGSFSKSKIEENIINDKPVFYINMAERLYFHKYSNICDYLRIMYDLDYEVSPEVRDIVSEYLIDGDIKNIKPENIKDAYFCFHSCFGIEGIDFEISDSLRNEFKLHENKTLTVEDPKNKTIFSAGENIFVSNYDESYFKIWLDSKEIPFDRFVISFTKAIVEDTRKSMRRSEIKIRDLEQTLQKEKHRFGSHSLKFNTLQSAASNTFKDFLEGISKIEDIEEFKTCTSGFIITTKHLYGEYVNKEDVKQKFYMGKFIVSIDMLKDFGFYVRNIAAPTEHSQHPHGGTSSICVGSWGSALGDALSNVDYLQYIITCIQFLKHVNINDSGAMSRLEKWFPKEKPQKTFEFKEFIPVVENGNRARSEYDYDAEESNVSDDELEDDA